jgi:hypothetical protein
MKSILLVTCLLIAGTSLAQVKTRLYYNEYWWLQPSKSESITYYRKCTVDTVNGGFIGRVEDYEKVDNRWVLIMKGNFGTKKEHRKIGISAGGEVTTVKEYDEVMHRYDGDFVYYFRSGKKKWEGKFVNGNNIGTWNLYYANGQLRVKFLYDDKGRGTIIESYDRDGNKIEKKYLYLYEDPSEYAKDDYQATADHRNLALMTEFPFLKKFRDNTYEKDLAEDLSRYPKDESDPILVGWDSDVEFPGGLENYAKMLREKIIYPKQALKNKIEGLVIGQIVVGNDGLIEDITVLTDIGGGCGEEFTRVIQGWQPRFTPARKGNKLIRKYILIPVYFELP